ncbi:hypothetical protein AB0F20_10255 [Streptomyces goshikiensis]|uniref:hypothetical protein n=1 Tax=Streptomyces goshikiensis TaxID=1942 RepID=UPI0033EB2DE2
MKSLDEVKAAFALLPERVTLKQIADATDRELDSVRNWVYDKTADFPKDVPPPGPRGTKLRDRDAVLAWYEAQPFAAQDTTIGGPRNIAETARRARPRHAKMDTKDLARTLGITVRGVNYYAAAYTPEKSENPFPAADENGQRDWPAVRSWILENAERDRKPSTPSTRDERGLTAREQEVLQLVQDADARGEDVTVSWLTDKLGLKSADSARRLLRAIEKHRGPAASKMLRPVGLAEAANTTTDMIQYYAKTYGPDSADPFPAKNANGERNVDDVTAWIKRRQQAQAQRRS